MYKKLPNKYELALSSPNAWHHNKLLKINIQLQSDAREKRQRKGDTKIKIWKVK